jgi:hypothetical protein
MSVDTQRVTIEIDAGEPIRGRLLDGAGASRPFRGWLELSSMLERLRKGGGDSPEGSAQKKHAGDA